MKKRLLVLGMAGMLVLGSGFELGAQEQLTEEELLFMEIPMVVTAAKREQPITEAPSTISVITAEDIKESGATNIPDILRMIPGVDVISITARDQQVSIRGFNDFMSNKLLVMIDGRSVYWDAMGNVFWSQFPITLEEIKQIEIVRGPGSSLYGANAYCGVINIITKSPAEINGAELKLAGGEYNTFIGSTLYSGVTDKFDYKASAELDMTEEWRDKNESAGAIIRGNALVGYKIGAENKISLSLGRAHFKDHKLYASWLGTGELKGNFDYLQLNWGYSKIKLRTFLSKQDSDMKWLETGEKQRWLTMTYDSEFQHSLDFWKRNSLIWGVNYRYNTVNKNDIIPDDYTQNLWAVFLEDEFKITDKLKLTLGGRYDYHPLVKEHFSPRGSLFYSPVKDHIFRFSVSNAFRNPTFIDSYIYDETQTTMLLPPPLPPIEVPYSIIIKGNDDLKSEGIISYELGYGMTLFNRLKSNLNLFYNEYTDFLGWSVDYTYYEAGELGFLHPGGTIPKIVTASRQNEGEAWGVGGEIGIDILITGWLSGWANYSYQEITELVNGEESIRSEDPRNKVNAGLKTKFENGISAGLFAHWVDETRVDDYLIINTRAGYAFWEDKAEVSLAIFNLIDKKHYEYPPELDSADIGSDKIGRKITASLNYKF